MGGGEAGPLGKVRSSNHDWKLIATLGVIFMLYRMV